MGFNANKMLRPWTKKLGARKLLSLFIGVYAAALIQTAKAQQVNGFDLSTTSIDKYEIAAGGPPRDGIPSIDNPKFVSPSQVNYLKDSDIVLGFSHEGIARAYPLRILVWHEVANDVINGKPIAVTYCPLCGTGMVFNRHINGKTLTFGVSGLLYRSDVLLYDRESDSLWSQLGRKAVSGSANGTQLEWLPSEHKTWQAWKQENPNGEVLSIDTGHQRNYGGEAYASYFAGSEPMFPVPQRRHELPNMSKVLGVIVNGEAKAYPLKELSKNNQILDTVGGDKLTVTFDPTSQFPRVTNDKGKDISSVVVFWFAWQAFYERTGVWKSTQQ